MWSAPAPKGREGQDPLAGLGKSHGACWGEGKSKGTLSAGGSGPANTKPDGTPAGKHLAYRKC